MRCTKAVIYKDNLRNNLNAVRSIIKPGTKICAAVKADGYGCGAVTAARTAVDCGVEYLAVATVNEGIELRENGITVPILLLSLCTKDELADLVKYGITPLVFDSEMIQAVNEAASVSSGKKFGVFLALDTGMGRIGCLSCEAAAYAEEIESAGNLKLCGMITHFAVSDSVSEDNRKYTEAQFADFKNAIESVRNAGIDPGICTCANSAATLDRPEMHLDMVRPGIIIYGYYPAQITREYLERKGTPVDLKPVMQFETEIVAIRRFSPGKSVSYGRAWTADKETDIAVLPVGYADGLLRRYSPGLKIAVNGKLYPVCGRICMDQCMVDIGLNNRDVKRWDKAVIFGPLDKGALCDADDIAVMTGTISYEVMTSVTKRVARTVI